MGLTLSGRYALKIMIYLATKRKKVRFTSSELSVTLKIPKNSLVTVIRELSNHAFLRTRPGPHGGILKAQDCEHRTLREVVETVRGMCAFGECFFSDWNLCAI